MSKQHRTTVQINGKTYDAITGNLLSSDQIKNNSPASKKQSPGISIDGFVKKPHVSFGSKLTVNPSAAQVNQSQASESSIHPASKIHSAKQHSQTLHRKAVNRPVPKSKKISNNFIGEKPNNTSVDMVLSNRDQQRLTRANQIPKSSAVAKFFQECTKSEEEIISKSIKGASQDKKHLAQVQHLGSAQSNVNNQSSKEYVQPNHKAGSQSAPKPKKQFKTPRWLKKSRTKSLIASSITVILLLGYITYINIPRAALKIASSKAGFSAELPGYNPSGFKFSGPISYAPGQITLEYKSNTDDRKFSLTQKETAWDSQTLLDNYVLGESDLYSTYQERGLIVYIFGGSNATWVNGGIWYSISGPSNLTAEQMLKIAASL